MSTRSKVIIGLLWVTLAISLLIACGGSGGNDIAVQSQSNAPVITNQPASQTVTTGQTATFSVTAIGTAPLGYQWKKNNTSISGATQASYTTPATTTSNNGDTFTVVITNGAGSVASNPATLTVSAANLASQITQYGITWTFDKPYQTGQFVNGDYWVVGPVNIIEIYPRSEEVSGRTINGSMLNPSPSHGVNQGFDSSAPALTYFPNLNVALNVSASTPLLLQTGTSLVSSISLTAEETASNTTNLGNVSVIKTAAILTVLASAPANGSFRPTYCGTDKTITHNMSELNANFFRLKKLSPVANTPSLSTVERLFERPWLDHISGWNARSIKPFENLPDYGREISRDVGIGALMLHLNFTDAQKQTLLIRFIQVGLDLYGIVKNGGTSNWWPAGGQNGGRKWPILFAGIMLSDANMQAIGAKSGDYLYTYNYPTYGPGNLPPDFIQFQEDDQTFYVTAGDVARTHSALWNPDTRGGTPEPYTSGDIGLAEWGIFHSFEPYADNKAWTAEYRLCCSNISMDGIVLAARIMQADSGAMTLWNHPALFDYQDRYMARTAASASTPAWRYSVSGMDGIWATNPGWRSWDTFSASLWDEYRDNY